MKQRKDYDISECRQCFKPCYVLITSHDLGLCNECKGDWRDDYERVIDRIMEPLPERGALNMPNPDSWIEGQP